MKLKKKKMFMKLIEKNTGNHNKSLNSHQIHWLNSYRSIKKPKVFNKSTNEWTKNKQRKDTNAERQKNRNRERNVDYLINKKWS